MISSAPFETENSSVKIFQVKLSKVCVENKIALDLSSEIGSITRLRNAIVCFFNDCTDFIVFKIDGSKKKYFYSVFNENCSYKKWKKDNFQRIPI